MKILLVIFICISLGTAQYNPRIKTYKFYDLTSKTDKKELIKLTKEILIESKYKVRQVTGIRDLYAKSLPFQVGIVIGKCREKYKRMMEIYRDINDRFDGRNRFYAPGIRYYKNIHPLIAMEMIRVKEREIDSMIQVLDLIPRKRFSVNVTKSLRMGSSGEDKNETYDNILRSVKLKEEEDELKRKMREEYEHNNSDRQRIDLNQNNNTESKPINWLLNAY